eukprot:CAMPEP_0176438570 /NCGR_PEP_ID=MMETSP0127-20121128/19375_1 /TAXON_ID=938130 /ORGANISM="Platyophrya macrostoma, Strain WH" /LENGTH=427 /DNA_ID=CAMNT_0017822571 /DNA_START=40 /DNA_END=1323 /DNA_ORIENTATION=-
MRKIYPYSSIQIDMKTRFLLRIIPELISPSDRNALQQVLEELVIKKPDTEKLLTTLSVRTAWDLFLQAMDFPLGSEVIMTAVNIPEMVKIPRYHGLIPIPVEIDFKELKAVAKDIEAKITPQTKCIMISYLFGAEYDITDIINVAKKHNIMVIEDSAESFHGPQSTGHPGADLSLYSFGTIKINTSYGGSLAIIRNNEVLYRKMKHILESYSELPNKMFVKKIGKNAFPWLGLNWKPLNKYGRLVVNYGLGIDHREMMVSLIRGFNDESDFLEKFRKQLPIAMMAMLAMRLKAFNQADFEKKSQNLRDTMNTLVKGGVEVPGHGIKDRYFWLYPFKTNEKDNVFNKLQDRGVDVYKKSTQLKLVESPVGSKYEFPYQTKEFMDKLLYLPFHLEVPRDQLMEMAKEVIEVVKEVNAVKNRSINRQSKL